MQTNALLTNQEYHKILFKTSSTYMISPAFL